MSITETFAKRIKIVLGMMAVIWLSFLVNKFIFADSLNQFGIQPRSLSGMIGLVTHPFLHGGFGHIISNTFPFLIMGSLIVFRDEKGFIETTVFVSLIGGAFVWIFGQSGSNHIGASILIYGYFSYLLGKGWFDRDILSLVVSLIVIFMYWSIIFGTLPFFTEENVSWEGHLGGFLAGGLAAYANRKPVQSTN